MEIWLNRLYNVFCISLKIERKSQPFVLFSSFFADLERNAKKAGSKVADPKPVLLSDPTPDILNIGPCFTCFLASFFK